MQPQRSLTTLIFAFISLVQAVDVCVPGPEEMCNFGLQGVVWDEVDGAYLHDHNCKQIAEQHSETLVGDKWTITSNGVSPNVFVYPKITQGKYGDITDIKFTAGNFVHDGPLECRNETVEDPGVHRMQCRAFYPCDPAQFRRAAELTTITLPPSSTTTITTTSIRTLDTTRTLKPTITLTPTPMTTTYTDDPTTTTKTVSPTVFTTTVS
ncbi:hypothetical protein DL546_006671 [Coniochaeta pulveracea]|uniref:Uncharacterized protein n=1 Tax=Coniochaeta pulveracea TaxID=177199 RepID=A0A420YCI8_9PEZI|nr:hypothetical protein DL546_006671 [Coniochaeta pulveracea]